jgi:hypothetical protein
MPNGVCSDENEVATTVCRFGQASSSANLDNSWRGFVGWKNLAWGWSHSERDAQKTFC